MPVNNNIPRTLATNALVPFSPFLNGTPVVPDVYWDIYSNEQRLKWLFCNFYKLVEYVNKQTEQINANTKALNEFTTSYASEVPQLEKRIEALEQALKTIVTSMLVYDPTKGTYTASIDQSRRMLQILATPDENVMTVDKLANSKLTVNDFANKYICAQVINESMKRFASITIPTQEVGE